MPNESPRTRPKPEPLAAYAAFLRGINVGRAKRVAMADLRELVTKLGYRDVKTLLNSGNVVFRAGPRTSGDPGPRIESAIAKALGVTSRVTVFSQDELQDAVDGNPLLKVATDPARLLVVFLADPADVELQGQWQDLGGLVAGSVAGIRERTSLARLGGLRDERPGLFLNCAVAVRWWDPARP